MKTQAAKSFIVGWAAGLISVSNTPIHMASKRLGLGKLPPSLLERYVLARLGSPSQTVALGPGVGVDFGAIRLGGRYLIVSTDPVTGAQEHVGWIAVHVCANDVATSGNPPRYLQVVLLLPEGVGVRGLSEITREVDAASRRLGLTVVRGHTEVTPGLTRPIVCASCFTFADRFVSARDARAGDSIVMTKTAGLEGTAILGGATTQEMLENLSVVGEAVEAFRIGGVDAMHDCTEGGVLGALYEMARASSLGFTVYEERIPVDPKTRELCAKLDIDPLKLISSGTLLIAARPRHAQRIIEGLRQKGYAATEIGEFTSGPMVLVRSGGRKERIVGAPRDELWRILEERGGA